MKRITYRRMRTFVSSCRTHITAMKMINPGKFSLRGSVTMHKHKRITSIDTDQDPECTNLCKVLAVSTVQESMPCQIFEVHFKKNNILDKFYNVKSRNIHIPLSCQSINVKSELSVVNVQDQIQSHVFYYLAPYIFGNKEHNEKCSNETTGSNFCSEKICRC